jgi:hypothetical protein
MPGVFVLQDNRPMSHTTLLTKLLMGLLTSYWNTSSNYPSLPFRTTESLQRVSLTNWIKLIYAIFAPCASFFNCHVTVYPKYMHTAPDLGLCVVIIINYGLAVEAQGRCHRGGPCFIIPPYDEQG